MYIIYIPTLISINPNHILKYILHIAAYMTALLLIASTGCHSGNRTQATGDVHTLPDTLRVGTLYSPISFFIYRGDSLGYDYDLAKQLAADKGMVIDLKIAPSMNRMIEMLDSGIIDLAAYNVPITAEYRSRVVPCGYETITSQVLVQPKSGAVADVAELIGKDVYVEGDSKYQHRMDNLNDELGGGINIIPVNKDTIIAEDLIDMVSTGKIPMTVVDSDIAAINATYYSNLDISIPVSLEQRSAWGVAPDKRWLADSIDTWMAKAAPQEAQKELLKQYFQLSKIEGTTFNIDFSSGKISKYDNLFRRYAPSIDWDWRMLAAQAYTESKFNPRARSWVGAAGLMQIMPKTARAYGLRKVYDPESSVKTAVNVIADLDKMLEPYVKDPEERKKFVMAAYNGGIGHVFDAIRLAQKHGKNPQVWDGNVAEMALMLANPAYYNDPVVQYGYLRGRETYNYVDRIMEFYNAGKAAIPV